MFVKTPQLICFIKFEIFINIIWILRYSLFIFARINQHGLIIKIITHWLLPRTIRLGMNPVYFVVFCIFKFICKLWKLHLLHDVTLLINILLYCFQAVINLFFFLEVIVFYFWKLWFFLLIWLIGIRLLPILVLILH